MLLIMSTTLMSSEMVRAAASDDRIVDQDGVRLGVHWCGRAT
jgi:hypothetical protein